MNNFFGSSPVTSQNGKQIMRVGETSRKNKLSPLYRKVFTKRMQDIESMDPNTIVPVPRPVPRPRIIKQSLADLLNERKEGDLFSHSFKAKNANLYLNDEEQEKIVQIKIIDIVFNKRACSLVCMQVETPPEDTR